MTLGTPTPATITQTGLGTSFGRIKAGQDPAKVIEENKNNMGTSGGKDLALKFPSDLHEHHMMQLEFFSYPGMNKSAKKSNRNSVDKIFLPVPANLVDTQNIDLNQFELGAVSGAIAQKVLEETDINLNDGFLETLKSAGKGMFNVGKSIYRDTDFEGIAQAFTATDREEQSATAITLNKLLGSVPNPFITAIFKGVGLKTHSFTWKLSPANEQESKTLNNIIRALRVNMLPSKSSSGLLFSFPNDCDISLVSAGSKTSPQNYLYNFKEASILNNAQFNFAPDGLPSFYGGTGAPTAIQIKLDFTETQVWTREDYGAGTDVDEAGLGPTSEDYKGIAQ